MHAIVGGLTYAFVLEMLPDIRCVALEEIELFYDRCAKWGFKMDEMEDEEEQRSQWDFNKELY